MSQNKFSIRLFSMATMMVLHFMVFISCKEAESHNERVGTTGTPAAEKTFVKIALLRKTSFSKEIISNGKLEAVRKADLKFNVSERVQSIHFKNGDYVKHGEVVAELDDFMLTNALRQSESRFEQVKFDLRDILIGQGIRYSDENANDIASEVLRVAKIKSGYDKAFHDLELARHNLANTKLRAPFSGLIANLKFRENNVITPGENFCTVIDNRRFDATFPLLEFEAGLVKVKQMVTVTPFAKEDVHVSAEISKINPIIDDNGLIEVSATCINPGNGLFEGMNVKVVIDEDLGRQLVVPKEAVVLRNERQVVFTYSQGKAKWNYVKTRFENSTSFVISEGISEGDSVIVDGNFNLVHNSSVNIAR